MANLIEQMLRVTGVTQATTIMNEREPNITFLGVVLNEWLKSPQRSEMLLAEEYYAAKNPTIKAVEKILKDKHGKSYKIASLSNMKLGHAFLRKLVNQKIAYLLSKEFGMQVSNKQSKDAIVASKESVDKFASILQDRYFTKEFYTLLKNVGKDAIKGGIGWLYVYYDDKGQLCFSRIPTHEVYAFWKDVDHTVLDGVLRTYTREHYDKDGNKTLLRKVEYYNAMGVWYFQQTDKGLVVDPDAKSKKSAHFEVAMTQKDEKTGEEQQFIEEYTFDKIPFIPIKYNSEEYSLLYFIKELIDAYDRVNSESVNNIIDIPNAIKVIIGFDGAEKDEYINNVNILRSIFVRDGGDVKSLTTPLDGAGVDLQLERLRKDIYEFGGGVDANKDTQNIASGVSLKFKYSDLDLDCMVFWNEIASALERIVWFICQDLLARGEEDYTNLKIDFIPNTDMAINETEVISNLNNSTMLSTKTKLAYHPYVNDVEDEEERLREEAEQQATSGIYDFTKTNVNPDGTPTEDDKNKEEQNTENKNTETGKTK